MARRVFFSFHYQNDVWRANQVRNSHIVDGTAAAGFQDGSLWEEAKKKGDAAIKKLIDDGLSGTTVTHGTRRARSGCVSEGESDGVAGSARRRRRPVGPEWVQQSGWGLR
jgi:hypothetical protein